MKLLLTGAESPTAKALGELLRQRDIPFVSLSAADLDAADTNQAAKIVSSHKPDQVVNLAAFEQGSQHALFNARKFETECRRLNTQLITTLALTCTKLDLPLLQLSSCYVFDGEKKLGYNELDEPNPQGVYGRTLLAGETALQKYDRHVLIRGGWLFGPGQDEQVRHWIDEARRLDGTLTVGRRRFSPTPTEDLARVILAVCLQVDCGANVWGTYHYCGLETKKESEFVQQVLKYAAQHDETIYQMLENISISEKAVRAPEITNSTLSSKKIFDTFGIKQRSWHGSLQHTIKTLYQDRKSGDESVMAQSRGIGG
ncbi:MAG: sugar nucleotide-binding protein [Pseudohongiellaceae bacterium]